MIGSVTATDTHTAIDAVWRIESPRLIAGLARIVRDIGVAEELAQDALVAALEQWPASGVPRNPGAWLMAAAKHRAIDHLRRNKRIERKHEELGRDLETQQTKAALEMEASAQKALADDDVGDDLLRLMFTACHPVLAREARVALTLRLLGGLSTEEIARAFLVPEPTIAQRIVRAKRTLAEKQVPFEVPRGEELAARLSSVLEVLYLVFNEGYSATSGEEWLRPALCEDALRLGRILAELAPTEPEVHGLVALMEIQASRARARVGASGEPILLLEQNRALWDHLLIRRGLAALDRAQKLERPRTLRAASGHSSLPCASSHGRRDGLDRDSRAVWGSDRTGAVADCGAESRGRGRNGVWSTGGPRCGGHPGRGAIASGLPFVAQRPRGSAPEAGATRRSPSRVRARSSDDAERARAGDASGSRRHFRKP